MDALTALAQWIHVLALALWVGSLLVLLLLAPGARRVHREDMALLEPLRERAQSLAWWALIALIATLAVEILARGAALTGAGGLGGYIPALKQLLFGTRYGAAAAAQWVLLVVSLYAVDEFGRAPALAPLRAPRPGRHALGIVAAGPRRADAPPARAAWVRLAAALAAAVTLCMAIGGPFGGSAAGALVESLHLGATLLWLGGALALGAGAPAFIDRVERVRRPQALLGLLDRFTPLAMFSVILLVLTGLWESAHAPTPPGRLSAAQGLAMTLKTLLLLAIVAVSAWGLFGPRPRLRRQSVRLRRDSAHFSLVEPTLRAVLRLLLINAVLAGLALLCGAIATTMPAGAAAAPRHGGLSVTGRAGPLTVTLSVAPDAPGRNTFTLLLRTARGAAVSGATVLVEARPPRAAEGGPGPTSATPLGGGRYQTAIVFSGGGRWDAHISVRTASAMAAALFRLTVPGAPAPTPMPTATPPARHPASGATAPGAWQLLGPSLIAHALVADPGVKSRLYEGTTNGVYRSLDGGKHWSAASSGLANASLEVWSLTHLPDGSLLAATGGGLYRSVDGALHWRYTGLGTRSIYTIATHQAGHVVLLAGGDGGIFRSDDMAAHWRQVYNSGAAAVASLAWPAARPALIIAGVDPGPNPIVISTDGGATWQAQSLHLPPIVGMMSVAVAPGARLVYAGAMGLGAFLSVGPDGVWLRRDTGLPGMRTEDAHIASFAFTPANPAVLYAATDYGVYRSMDAGLHWAPFGRGLNGDAAVVTALTLVTGPHPVLFATTANGLYRYPLGHGSSP